MNIPQLSKKGIKNLLSKEQLTVQNAVMILNAFQEDSSIISQQHINLIFQQLQANQNLVCLYLLSILLNYNTDMLELSVQDEQQSQNFIQNFKDSLFKNNKQEFMLFIQIMSLDNVLDLNDEEVVAIDFAKYKNVFQLQNLINQNLANIPEYQYLRNPRQFNFQGVQITNELLQTLADDIDNPPQQVVLDQILINLTNPQLLSTITSPETVMQLILSMQIMINSFQDKEISQDFKDQLQSFIPVFNGLISNYKQIHLSINIYLEQQNQRMSTFLQENMVQLHTDPSVEQQQIQEFNQSNDIEVFKAIISKIQYKHHLQEVKRQTQNYYGVLAQFMTLFAPQATALQILNFAQKETSYCIFAGHVISQYFRLKYQILFNQIKNQKMEISKQLMDDMFKLFGLMRVFVTKCNDLPLEYAKDIAYFYMETLAMKEFHPILKQNEEVLDQYVNYINSYQDMEFMETWDRFYRHLQNNK